MRRLVTAAPAPRRREPDRATLVAAERKLGLTGDEHGSAAVGGGAAQVRRIVGVRRLRVGIAGQPAAVEAEGGNRRLAHDVRAGVQQARHHRRVLARHVALHDGRAVEHRNPGHAHVVLDADRPARERPVGRGADRALPGPPVRRVLLADRPVPDVLARIGDRQALVGQLVEPREAGERRPGQLGERGELLVTEPEPVLLGYAGQLGP